jgi:hypothetical protein
MESFLDNRGIRFRIGKNRTAIVKDIYEVKSITTGETINYMCMAQAEGELTLKHLFEVAFSFVERKKI